MGWWWQQRNLGLSCSVRGIKIRLGIPILFHLNT